MTIRCQNAADTCEENKNKTIALLIFSTFNAVAQIYNFYPKTGYETVETMDTFNSTDDQQHVVYYFELYNRLLNIQPPSYQNGDVYFWKTMTSDDYYSSFPIEQVCHKDSK